MKNLLCFCLITFLTKRVTSWECYTSKPLEQINPCIESNKNLPEEKQIESNIKCLTESTPKVEPCSENNCYSMITENNGRKVGVYGCGSLCEVDKQTYPVLVFPTMPGTRAMCNYCSYDKCNDYLIGEQNKDKPESSPESMKNSEKSNNGVSCIVPNTTVTAVLIFFCFVFNFIL